MTNSLSREVLCWPISQLHRSQDTVSQQSLKVAEGVHSSAEMATMMHEWVGEAAKKWMINGSQSDGKYYSRFLPWSQFKSTGTPLTIILSWVDALVFNHGRIRTVVGQPYQMDFALLSMYLSQPRSRQRRLRDLPTPQRPRKHPINKSKKIAGTTLANRETVMFK
jgi:hypothetical protein